MSCNSEDGQSITSKITILSEENGFVTGKRTRLTGSAGEILATPDQGYSFTRWDDENGVSYSTANPLVVSSWEDLSLTPVFDEIVISHADFVAADAVEAEVYYLEYHLSLIHI